MFPIRKQTRDIGPPDGKAPMAVRNRPADNDRLRFESINFSNRPMSRE